MDYHKFSTHEEEVELFFTEYRESFGLARTELMYSTIVFPVISKNNIEDLSNRLEDAYGVAYRLYSRKVPEEPDFYGEDADYAYDMEDYEDGVVEYADEVNATSERLLDDHDEMIKLFDIVENDTKRVMYWLTDTGESMNAFYANLTKYRLNNYVDRVYNLITEDFHWVGVADEVTKHVKELTRALCGLRGSVTSFGDYAEEISGDVSMVKSNDSSFMNMQMESVYANYLNAYEDAMAFGLSLHDRLQAYLYIVDRDTELFIGNLVTR